MMVAFFILAAMMVAGGIATITLRNAVHASLALVFTLLSLAATYFTLSAQFLGIVQIIVYAGAIMVLFLFVIMLLNAAQPESRRDALPWVRPLALAAAGVLAVGFVIVAFSFEAPRPLALVEAALRNGTPAPIGEVLFTRFLLPFEAVSILLLVAVVGAVSLVQRDPATLPASDEGEAVTVPEEPISGLGTPDRSATLGPQRKPRQRPARRGA
jgi:NADH-quinone oxidoreductase subunit J